MPSFAAWGKAVSIGHLLNEKYSEVGDLKINSRNESAKVWLFKVARVVKMF